LEGSVIETSFGSLEGSHAVPASPSGKGEACIGDFFNFDFKDVGAAVLPSIAGGRSFIRNPRTRHAVVTWNPPNPISRV
jgi:hypothetical protein